jgi:hypothetical protein
MLSSPLNSLGNPSQSAIETSRGKSAFNDVTNGPHHDAYVTDTKEMENLICFLKKKNYVC